MTVPENDNLGKNNYNTEEAHVGLEETEYLLTMLDSADAAITLSLLDQMPYCWHGLVSNLHTFHVRPIDTAAKPPKGLQCKWPTYFDCEGRVNRYGEHARAHSASVILDGTWCIRKARRSVKERGDPCR
jgi:hypothetical protein